MFWFSKQSHLRLKVHQKIIKKKTSDVEQEGYSFEKKDCYYYYHYHFYYYYFYFYVLKRELCRVHPVFNDSRLLTFDNFMKVII